MSQDMMREFSEEIKQIKQDYAAPGKTKVVKHARSGRGSAMGVAGTPWYFEDGLT